MFKGNDDVKVVGKVKTNWKILIQPKSNSLAMQDHVGIQTFLITGKQSNHHRNVPPAFCCLPSCEANFMLQMYTCQFKCQLQGLPTEELYQNPQKWLITRSLGHAKRPSELNSFWGTRPRNLLLSPKLTQDPETVRLLYKFASLINP